MADNEKEKASDLEIGPEAKKILGLTQPFLIKITIGLVILLVAVGGYFFFMTEEPPIEEVAETEMIDEDLLIAPPTTKDSRNIDEETSSKMMELREQSMTVREENLELREQSMTVREENLELREHIIKLESELIAVKNTNQQSVDKNTNLNTSVINNYDDESKAFPPIITESTKPRPKPKWGEFERVK